MAERPGIRQRAAGNGRSGTAMVVPSAAGISSVSPGANRDVGRRSIPLSLLESCVMIPVDYIESYGHAACRIWSGHRLPRAVCHRKDDGMPYGVLYGDSEVLQRRCRRCRRVIRSTKWYLNAARIPGIFAYHPQLLRSAGAHGNSRYLRGTLYWVRLLWKPRPPLDLLAACRNLKVRRSQSAAPRAPIRTLVDDLFLAGSLSPERISWDMDKTRALIVDDSSVMRKIVERSLRQAGLSLAQILEAGNGAEALAAVQKTRWI